MFYRCDLTRGWLGPNLSCFINLKVSSLFLAPRTVTHFSKQMPGRSEHIATGSARSSQTNVWRPTHESCKLGIVGQSTLEQTCTLHILELCQISLSAYVQRETLQCVGVTLPEAIPWDSHVHGHCKKRSMHKHGAAYRVTAQAWWQHINLPRVPLFGIGLYGPSGFFVESISYGTCVQHLQSVTITHACVLISISALS